LRNTPEFVEKYIDRPWYWGHLGLSSNTMSVAKRRRIAERLNGFLCLDQDKRLPTDVIITVIDYV
jgi:hypothetical protein